ncbi:MAG: glycoside hydrolase family 3 protein [Chitinivibrionales bacterium]|nr:glycoside hydrolase family 3 protein [Chitinivibrionales bacterium]
MATVKNTLHDPKANTEERIAWALAKLTLREKVSQLMHSAPAVKRLGIAEYNWWSECLHGVARAGRATVFPQAIGMAATFDRRLIGRVADAIADEARAKHHAALRAGNHHQYFGLTFWSPNVNLFRDPRWGRGQETWGEDPYLAGTLGTAFVKGLQGSDRRYLKAAACAKHYAVHSGPEKDRHTFNAKVNRRDLHETYLRAFRMLVKGGVESVMGAYNRTLDEPCCASRLLLGDILRGQWKFKGHVVSDCGAISDFHLHHKVTRNGAESAALAVRNGCDLNCGCTYAYLEEAIEKGLLEEADIDRALANLLRTRIKLGMFDPPKENPYAAIPVSVVGCEKHRALARETAAKSIVLLKNNGGLLPLDQRKTKRIMVLGPNAADANVLLGNYYGMNGRMVSVLEGIAGAVDDNTLVEYRQGCLLEGEKKNPLDWSTGEAKSADVAIAVMGLSPLQQGEEGEAILSAEVGDRMDIGLPPNQVDYLRRLSETGTPVVLVLTAGSAVTITDVIDFVDAILYVWYPGEEGGNAVADVLFGRTNPGGRLPVTIVKNLKQLPPFERYAMTGRTYRFMKRPPLFRFGFGLSYTRFSYSNLKLSKKRIAAGESVKVSVTVKNAGKVAGDEVVQLYVRDVEASVPVPQLHLEGFERVHLKPGAAKTVTFTLTRESLAAYDNQGQPFVEPGEFEIAVGGCQPVDPAFTGKKTTLVVR